MRSGKRRAARVLTVLALATLVSASAQASPVQVADGDYSGKASLRGTDGSQDFENDVSLTVFSGGTGLRGVIRYVVNSSVEFNGNTTPLCLSLVADFLTAPISVSGSGASGSVVVEQAFPDGACSSTTVFDSPLTVNADIALAFNGPTVTGTLTLPGEVPFVVDLRAERGGLDATTPSIPAVAGIEEFIDGVVLTEETADRLKELEACTPDDREADGRCGPVSTVEAIRPFLELYAGRFGGMAMAGEKELERAALVATLRDPNGDLLCPSLGPMFPVLLALRERSINEPSADVALNRLVGLLIAMDLDARK